jgi:aspartate carbamoyltransferase
MNTLRHILSVDQFDRNQLEAFMAEAERMAKLVGVSGGDNRLGRRVCANLFYEPSTRTSSSFMAAMQRLGGSVIPINDVNYSSVSKGETLEDTVRTLGQYADVVVLRHPEKGSAARAAKVSSVPIINAGDGIGEHPTQALLDLFTIQREQGKIDGLTVTMLGDLKHGRTVHSLAKLLSDFDVTLRAVAPKSLQLPEEYGRVEHFEDLEDALRDTDILYVTRVQKERFESPEEYEAVQGSYTITHDVAARMKPTASIMHPLPRVGEIHFDVDKDPRAAYFRQMQNGMFMRMALLAYVLGE